VSERLERAAAAAERSLAACVDRGEVLGLTWSISVDGGWRTGAIGHLDAPRTQGVEPDSIFRISSLTKPITATLALMLVEDGAISLGDAVDRWLPELADRQVLVSPSAELDDTVPAARPITLEDVLTFRLGHGMDFHDWSPTPLDAALDELGLGAGPPAPAGPPGPDEWIRRLGSVPLRFSPGERWLYHTGADVLGVLIGRVVGRPFEEVLHDRLLEPLGMHDTAFWVPPDRLDRFGACYGVDDSGERDVYDPAEGQWASPPAFAGGGAGLVSTVPDLQRFTDLLQRGGTLDGRTYLSPATVSAMTTNQLTAAQVAAGPTPNGWGYGLGMQIDPDGPLGVCSYGWNGGLGSMWCTDPTTNTIGLLLTNQMWTSPEPPAVCDALLAALALP
jgi:CubicO group peptidase (beta-lactamase class C family)